MTFTYLELLKVINKPETFGAFLAHRNFILYTSKVVNSNHGLEVQLTYCNIWIQTYVFLTCIL